MDEKRQKIIKKIYAGGIKKSKKIQDSSQKYTMLNDDILNIINNIYTNFDFKIFNKNTLQDAEIVRIFYFLRIFIVL